MIIKTYVTIQFEAGDILEAAPDLQMWEGVIHDYAGRHGGKFQVEIENKRGRRFSPRPSRKKDRHEGPADEAS